MNNVTKDFYMPHIVIYSVLDFWNYECEYVSEEWGRWDSKERLI